MRLLFSFLLFICFTFNVLAQGDALPSNRSFASCLTHQVEPVKAILTDYDLVHYDFDLQLERNSRNIAGSVTILAKAVKGFGI